jgi:hypothetical protein
MKRGKMNKKSKKAHSRVDFEREKRLLTAKTKSFWGPKKFKFFMESTRSQITIFVIIALLIVVSIALLFVFIRKPSAISLVAPERPDTITDYIRQCASDYTLEAVSLILPHGGFLQPSLSSSLKFNNTQVIWLCYTPFNEQVCTNRHPMLQSEVENEIAGYIKPKLEACFADVKNKLGNYDYKEEPLSFGVNILPKTVYINMTKKITYTSGGRTISLKNFDTAVSNSLYDIIRIAIEAVNQEVKDCDCSQTCNADIFGLNTENKDYFEIKRFISGSNEKIYTIIDRLTGKKFNFAVRNCIPNIPS